MNFIELNEIQIFPFSSTRICKELRVFEKMLVKKNGDLANHQQNEKVKMFELSVFNGTSFVKVEIRKRELCYFKAETKRENIPYK